LLNVHIDKLNLCYGKRAAKIGNDLSKPAFLENKKSFEIARFLQETIQNSPKKGHFCLKEKKK
jgi:hypothetical protein